MKNEIIVSLKIGSSVLVSALVFFVLTLFWYNDYVSIKDFLNNFFIYKNFMVLIIIFLFSIIVGIISYSFVKKVFKNIEKYNTKLKDYNHFLAHELKTPISIINSNLEVLEYGFDKNKIDYSKRELKNITNIIDGLLSFSESFSSIEKKEINLENFIKGFISFKDYNNQVEIKNEEFNFSIETDEILFERVIKNLIENALKYSIDKKVIIIIKKDKLVFENKVYKTLEKEELEKICEKHYSKTCNENSGNGLGLSMIKEIIKVLGYELKVDSYDGKFFVEIIY